MVTHVGFTTTTETLSTYNTETGEEETFTVPLKLSKFDDIEIYTFLGAIVAKTENIGRVCLCLDADISNETRKQIIAHAQRLGINDIFIISPTAAMYLDVMHQHQIIPKVGEYIWVQYDTYFNIWLKREDSTQFITTCKLEEILESTTYSPDYFIYWSQAEIDDGVIKDVYPNCNTYTFNHYYTSKGALIKARIMANDGEFVCYGENVDYFKLPTLEKFFIDISVNENGVYSVKYLDINNEKLPPEENDAIFRSVFAYDVNKLIQRKFVVLKNVLESVLLKNVPAENESNITLQELEREIKDLLSLGDASTFKPESRYYLPKKVKIIDPNIEAVGIDLGTTVCCSAVGRKSGIETAGLDNIGQRLLPSYVTLLKDKDICGQVAVDNMRTNPSSTIFDAKRLIGKYFTDIIVDSSWPFNVYDDGNQILIGIENEKTSILLPPLVVSTLLLMHIKHKLEEYQGKELSEVVITTPSAFTPRQNIETVMAAIISGWNNVHLLPEPLAAAFAYFIDRTLPVNSHVLLFDLGGGTLDVCLLKIANDYIQIENTAGDSFLGGRDFDNLIINYIRKKLEDDYNIVVERDKKKYKLMLECQNLKHTLTALDEATLDVNSYNTEKNGIITITRTTFEAMAVNLLARIKSVIKNATSSFPQHRIEKVLLAGGGSRMPMIEKLLKSCFPNAELCKEENLDEVVAIGAAYYAYYLGEHSKDSTKSGSGSNNKKKDCLIM
uniref:Uncharacterized protein n=1 Tax=Panagrolaimus sp. ES5 TaxID=591445 RepID=A0AC34F015_9BILA